MCTLQVDQWIVIQPNQSLERVPSVRSWADADVWPSGAGGLLPGAVLSLPHDHSLSPEVPRPSALSPTDVPKPERRSTASASHEGVETQTRSIYIVSLEVSEVPLGVPRAPGGFPHAAATLPAKPGKLCFLRAGPPSVSSDDGPTRREAPTSLEKRR